MKIIDLSLTLSPDLVVWPGDPKIVLERVAKIEEGSNHNGSRLDISVHVGTHVDAPFHFLETGSGVDQLPLDILVGPAQVIEIDPAVTVLNLEELAQAGIQPGIQRVLFKTRNSAYWTSGVTDFQEDFVGIAADAAEFLVWQGVRLVGIDYLSVAPFRQSKETHQILLKHEVVVVEGLNLSAVKAGMYDFVCLPIKLGGSDGAPARAILIEA